MPFKALLLLSMAAVIPPVVAPPAVPTGAPAAAPAAAPASAISLSMPGSGLDLSISYRQIDTDLRPFLEGSGLDERDLHKLRVAAILAQGGKLATDMELRVGETLLPPGRYALGFTVGAGEAMNFFLAHGNEISLLAGEAIEPGWTSERLLLQLVYVTRNETHLLWHVGSRAGRITLHPGGVERDEAADEPSGR
ncbi:MAG: hypothetical protein ACYTCU_03390 [Planctomycetota bacterium]|jgi:hypothetical protein